MFTTSSRMYQRQTYTKAERERIEALRIVRVRVKDSFYDCGHKTVRLSFTTTAVDKCRGLVRKAYRDGYVTDWSDDRPVRVPLRKGEQTWELLRFDCATDKFVVVKEWSR